MVKAHERDVELKKLKEKSEKALAKLQFCPFCASNIEVSNINGNLDSADINCQKCGLIFIMLSRGYFDKAIG